MVFEPTCANARWALRSRFPSVCLSVCLSVRPWLDKNYWTIIHISGTKFGMVMDIDFILASRWNVTWVKVKGHIGQGQIRVPKKSRWAHINVKLLHFFSFCELIGVDSWILQHVPAIWRLDPKGRTWTLIGTRAFDRSASWLHLVSWNYRLIIRLITWYQSGVSRFPLNTACSGRRLTLMPTPEFQTFFSYF